MGMAFTIFSLFFFAWLLFLMEFINFFDEKYSIIIKQKIVTVLRLISSYGQGFLNQS